MKNPGIVLLKNRWLLTLMVGGYLVLIWSVFVVVNHEEIVRADLLRSPPTLQESAVMEMYGAFESHPEWIQDDVLLMRLTEALIHQGKTQEAQEVSLGLWRRNPDDRSLRFQVALALHNSGLYEEAETHFSILLEEREDK